MQFWKKRNIRAHYSLLFFVGFVCLFYFFVSLTSWLKSSKLWMPTVTFNQCFDSCLLQGIENKHTIWVLSIFSKNCRIHTHTHKRLLKRFQIHRKSKWKQSWNENDWQKNDWGKSRWNTAKTSQKKKKRNIAWTEFDMAVACELM